MAIKVLVIDDEKLLVKSTCMALSFYGFEAKGALDGREGLAEAVNFGPRVILLDIMMPGMDGWEVLSRLKAEEATKKIPVIIFTAKEHPNGTALARSKGAVDYVPKPFEPEDLVAVLNKYTAV
ncbi:MAG: response regulator [Chitinispirillaceae bacterium]|nr:response regulator [Chitinispirillaceae bacterium]